MADWYVYLSLVVATGVSFWAALMEATFLTVRPLSMETESSAGNNKAAKVIKLVEEKTRLVSTTTLLSTFADVILASTTGLIFSEAFGLKGWVFSTILVSLVIMVFLNLLPKAIGIENSVRMAMLLSPSTDLLLRGLSPVALPLTNFARTLSQSIVGKPAYKQDELVDEFESLLIMLEKAGHIEPDSGRILRSALASSKTTAGDLLTPIEEIVAVYAGSDVKTALRLMGKSSHPHLPVYDPKAKAFVGAVTFRSLFKAFGGEAITEDIGKYMVQPAKVDADETAAGVMDKMQRAGVTMAFVSAKGRIRGMVTVTDILEVILGTKMRREGLSETTKRRGAAGEPSQAPDE
jgi:putative hemolysin